MAPALLVLLILGTAAGGMIGTGLILPWLRRHALDVPNERSLHTAPTPRGAGLVLVPVALGGALMAGTGSEWGTWLVVALPALALTALSFADDLWCLPALPRLLGHATAVGAVLLARGADGSLSALPVWMELSLVGALWVWLINAFNFMDGIDGAGATGAVTIGGGAAVVALVGGAAPGAAAWGLSVAGASLGFLAWNRPPARVFWGDAGSVPLGFLLGWVLFELWAAGQWVAACLLPAYIVADATLTLGRRLARGARIWSAHREHLYQRAVRAGARPTTVLAVIAGGDATLAVAAVVACGYGPWLGGALGCGALLALLVVLGWMARGGQGLAPGDRAQGGGDAILVLGGQSGPAG